MMMIHSGKFPIVIIVLLTFISPLESGLITKTRIDQDEIWALEESPFIVQKDVLITAKLEIEPGVNVRFKPEAGLTIRGDGVLVAEGYESRLIKFLPDEYIVESSPDFNRTARLVDGPTINEGIVQVLEKGKWRSVCTNSRNWTQIDLEVTCRQLGFQGGEWHHWFPHLNDTQQILYEDPGCTGLEPRLDLCNWSRRRMGSGVCDHHPNLGIRCLPFHHKENRLASGHWRGLRFESAQFIKELTIENTLYVSSSRSILKFVEIIGAGRGTWRGRPNATSAVESWGIPPRMEHIHIRHCAYNGINITNPEGRVIIKNANITLNRGYGVFVNSSTGDINILDSVVSNNMGDGIKYYMHDKIPDPKVESGVDIHDFCTYSTTYSQTYPFMMVAEQYYNSAVNRVCGKRFYTQHGFLITLHFVHMISEENEGAILEIYDGSDTNSRLIVSVNVRNYTRPESAVSTGNNMYILFKADRKMKAEVFLEITAGPHRAFDLNVTNSNVAHNSGRGIWVQKMRSAVHLHKTQVWGHNHVAGLNVEYGSGDINVTESKISQNWVDGINITYAGGTQNISRSKLHNNLGHGFAVWFNETSVNYPIRQETIIQYSSITLNKDVGVLVGNYCGPALVNISGNHFTDGQSIALQILSCWKEEKNELINTRTPTLRLQIGNNFFERHKRVAIFLSPLSKAYGFIEHNDFLYNDGGCIYIWNENDFMLESQPVDLTIHENRFKFNKGSFVLNLGLNHIAVGDRQSLIVKFNWIQNNIIKEPWPGLNPRSRVAAPVVLSSKNVLVFRNLIDNPESRYEIGSHLVEPNSALDCRKNWLGHKDEQTVWRKIFDRDDRYNLAKIDYVPYLLSNNINTELVLERPEWEPQFINSETKEVGGDVTGVEELRSDGVYIVKRDINVRPSGRLKITPGVTLKFETSVGMMIAGELIAEGDLQGGQPLLTLSEKQPIKLLDNSSDYVVRLVGGSTTHEGRLEIKIDDVWGTVCNFGWTIESAAIACQQIGGVLNPEDWLILPGQLPDYEEGPIHLSNVRCGPLDTDIRYCLNSESTSDFYGSCNHNNDVGIKCFGPSWSGIRLGMTAKRSKLYDVRIEKAGLFDYRIYKFVPAIQVDFSHHVFEHLDVSNNDNDGFGLSYSDIYYPDKVNFIKNCKFNFNKRHGLSFKQLGMRVVDTEILGNSESGIHHDPKLDKLEQRELREWMSLIDEGTSDTIISIPNNDAGTSEDNPIIIKEKESRLIVSSEVVGKSILRRYHVRTERDEFVIGMQLLNPFHNHTTEQLIIYDFKIVSDDPNIQRFNVSRDIASFPQISSSYSITLEYNTGKAALGNLMLLLTPIHCADLPSNCNSRSHHINPIHRSKIVPGSFPRLTIHHTKILENRRGLSTIHYNRYLGHDNQVYLRKSNESIEIYDSEISSNREEAFYVFTPFRELNQFNISETTYMINRTKFFDNGRGIFQYSKDLRDSNNLYHWVLRENIFENNVGGGFDVALPYVWQYNENYTHTVHIDSNIIRKNQGFDIHIRGHFARVYVVNNTIVENVCHQGILALRGMEKEARIFGNVIQNNDGVYMVEFDTDSHSSINGFVSGYFSQNIVQRNTNSEERFNRSSYYFHPASYAIAVKGVQRVNLTDNLLGNPGLDYELLSGLRTARASNHLNAQKNYWGSSDERIIQQSIFDFDDWNSFAVTNYLPYYEQNDFDSLLSGSYRENEKDVSKILDNLGGRLWQSLRLVKRGRPYVVKSDLTIMPEVTLTIDPGVQIEFYPSVGILVLGTLQARGSIDDKIIFKPARNNEVKDIRVKPQMPLRNKRKTKHYYKLNDKNKFEVRLCQANENGTICPPHINQGFVELFNQTTKQWVPICDKRFSERNAQVVCRQLGFSDINVHLDFGKRIEYHINSLTRIIVWPEPYQCMGKEPSLAQCDIRMNGQIYGHTYGCDWKGSDFAFIHCGDENLPDHYDHWGGIRFSVKEFEQELFHTRVHDAVTHSTLHYHESILEYIEIIGAGILHGEKSPAIQAVMSSPHITQIVIKNSAHDGINLISPSRTLTMLHNLIENNLGIGISAAVLSGEVREAELSAFIPLKEVPIPYHVFGLVDICDPQKEIVIEERILLYYKYDNNPVDCVKIFSSIFDVKPLGFRLLQFNLVDSQGESWTPDHLALYDGDLYNASTLEIVTIKVDGTDNENKLYSTTRNHPMSIKFHATGARENMGFVAEVVTLPVSAIGIDRNILHNVSFSVFDGNQRGAIDYTSAGEINPIVTIQRNRFINNGLSLYGNFSTCKYGSVNLDVQNTRDMFFYNNYVSGNVGGFRLKSGSSGTATAMRGLLHNNVFADNVKKTTLALEGRQTSPYQQITLIKNYFTRSDVPYETAILFDQVVCNATFNTIHNNRGKSIMEVKGFSNVRLPIYQSFTHNGFFNNEAYGDHCDKTTLQTCTYGIRATVVAGSPGQQYVDNIFYNRNNDYELVTLNRSEWDVWKTPINAKYNYWAYNETYAVAGRIKDLNDEDGLLEVDFTPFQMNNKTLLSGIKCYPGWTLIDNTCFMYFGGPMTYKEAEEFCLKDNSSVPYVNDNFLTHYLGQYLLIEQDDWRYYDMVWVKHLDSGIGECTVYVNGDVESADCDLLLPTLCENDPHPEPLTPFTSFLTQEVVYFFLAFIACFILIFIICCLWCSNTRRKQKERFERRNSIRMSKSSLAGSRSLVSVASTGFTDVNYRKRILSNSKDGNMVSTSPYGPGITPTATINPSSRNTGNNSYDSLADKPSLGLNSTADDEIQSYEIYEAQNNRPQPSASSQRYFGNNFSPNYQPKTFAESHDVHYSTDRQPWPDPWKNSEPSREPSHVDNTTSSSEVESSNDGSATSASSHRDPYSAPTYASFRPQSRQKNQQPQPPQQPNDNSKSRHRIPSVPGYARPFAHSNAHENNLSVSTRLLDISQDSAVNNLRNSSIRSRSVGQILETNFDEVDDPPNTDDKLKHSMSMGDSALAHLTLSPLETEM
ncbi:protein bark beetle [Lepeophtheirus salmonis]|uniref:protein bark beetle n=1 Tax=Lepeophtheirus salmonis TaxID=72036 RepID=UPI001AE8831E|nr:protein bark beetle-like [Lepeophtheirus salmonis]